MNTTNQEAFALGFWHGYLNNTGANPYTWGSALWTEYEKGWETWSMFKKNNRL